MNMFEGQEKKKIMKDIPKDKPTIHKKFLWKPAENIPN